MAKQIEIVLTSGDIEKFYNKIRRNKPNDCLIYIGCKDKDGYGLPRVGKKHIRAHRIAWFLAYGKIPEGLCVLHKCDNTSCVNPKHLFLGSDRDNNKDMINKQRNAYGEKNGGSKLTENQVLDILNIVKSNGRHRNLATNLSKIYKIDSHTIRNIITGRNWKYLFKQFIKERKELLYDSTN